MEMTLTVHVPRRRPRPVDVVVEWAGIHTTGDLCAALAEHLGEAVPGLTSRGRPVDPATAVGMPPLVHGASVAVTTAPPGPGPVSAPRGLLELVVVGGPDAGRSQPLLPPGVSVGRAPATGLALADDSLSRVHAHLDVGPSGVTVADAGSTNGVLVDGSQIEGVTPVDAASVIVVGSTTLRIRRVAGRGLPLDRPGDGTLLVSPSPHPEPAHSPVEVRCPPPPPERHRVRIPWVAALVPVPIGVALAVFLGPYLLVFALLGPVVLLATALGDRWGSGRAHRRAVDAHSLAVDAARARLHQALAEEAALLRHIHPDPHAVLVTAERALPGLWAGVGAAHLRIGLGAVPTRVAWVDAASSTHPCVDNTPVVVDLAQVGALAAVGPPEETDRLLTALVGQLCTSLPPHALSIAVAASGPSWGWVALVPQATDIHDLLAQAQGASRPGGGSGSVSGSGSGSGSGSVHRVLVVPHGDDGAGGVTDLVSRARDAGVLVLVAVSERSSVPAGGTAVVCRGADDRHVLQCGGTTTPVTLDLVGAWWAERLGRALAPLRTREASAGGGLPRTLTLAEAMGTGEISPAYVLDRWRDGAGPGRSVPPVAVVGATADGPFAIDLRRDGPHVLVGGTTGSGKSEFLRTLVASLAVACPAQELTFVLVDFKGGAAFGSCAALPHVVGLVTDLDEHLVERALLSLGAELRRRERIFAAAGASDLDAYRRVQAPGSEAVPRLVVVIDELRALVDEVPQFVSGLVRLAALGRSLGVHLVLATQRPAGAVTAEIQANVNLRIAFRVRDRSDSVDILEDPSAAGIRSSTPGRALCRGGEGTLVAFHAATVNPGASEPVPHLHLHRPGAPRPPTPDAPAGSSADDGSGPRADRLLHGGAATDATPVIAAVLEAHRRSGAVEPRAPWLPPLPSRVPPVREQLAPEPGAEVEVALGLLDEPELQRVSALTWTPADGTWLVAGRPGSGRTTSLRTLVIGVASCLGPQHLHVHVIDPLGALADLEHLPQLGTRIGPDDHRGLASLVDHLRREVEARRASGRAGPRRPLVVVVVDGWDQLVESQGLLDADGLLAALLAVLRDGPSVGVVGAVSGGRSLLQPRWSGIGGHTFLLGPVDPLDAALAGLRLADLPRDPPPGRAVRVHDRREAQFCVSTPGDAHALGAAADDHPGTDAPWRWRELPALVRRPANPGPDAAGPVRRDAHPVPTAGSIDRAGSGPQPLGIGVAAPSHDVWWWRPEEVGRRLLISGPHGSGRTNALATIAGAASAAGRAVVVLTGNGGAHDESRFGAARVLLPTDVDALVTLRRQHPDLVLLVDDADRVHDDAPVLPALREVIDLVDRDRGLVAVTTTTSSLATRFRGLDVDLARHGTGILLNPARAEGDLLGVRLPDVPPRMPGRGLVVSRGQVTEIQVFLADVSVGRVPRLDLGLELLGSQRSETRREGQHDDEPAHQGHRPLDESPTDREEQGAPHDRGGAGPPPVAEPPAGDQGQSQPAQRDEQGRHEHAGRVTALPDDQFVHVEDREAHECECLDAEQQRCEAAGAEGGGDGHGIQRSEHATGTRGTPWPLSP